jgi:hypothetical protein
VRADHVTSVAETPGRRHIDENAASQTGPAGYRSLDRRVIKFVTRLSRVQLVAGAPSVIEPPGPPCERSCWWRGRAYAVSWALHCSMSRIGRCESPETDQGARSRPSGSQPEGQQHRAEARRHGMRSAKCLAGACSMVTAM